MNAQLNLSGEGYILQGVDNVKVTDVFYSNALKLDRYIIVGHDHLSQEPIVYAGHQDNLSMRPEVTPGRDTTGGRILFYQSERTIVDGNFEAQLWIPHNVTEKPVLSEGKAEISLERIL